MMPAKGCDVLPCVPRSRLIASVSGLSDPFADGHPAVMSTSSRPWPMLALVACGTHLNVAEN